MIPMFGVELPAIATAAVVGIPLNLMLSVGRGLRRRLNVKAWYRGLSI